MIVIIDYGIGNLGSIKNMLKKLGIPAMVTADPGQIARATKLILPGVGAFDNGMKNLTDRGLIPVLNRLVQEEKVPILGICLGMQLLSRSSEEGLLPGLGWLNAETVRFDFSTENRHLKIPHMGWNTLTCARPSPLLQGLEAGARFYFVHSYHVRCLDPANAIAKSRHGIEFVAAVEHRNIFGAQFHPEKSHKYGLQLLRNFATTA